MIWLPVLYLMASFAFFYYFWPQGVEMLHIVGLVLTYGGFLFWFIGRFQLGSAFALTPQAKQLVTRGLYAKVRHPLYVSQAFVLIGALLFLNIDWLWLLAVPVFALQLFRIRKEEQTLEKAFGEEYLKYKKQTWF